MNNQETQLDFVTEQNHTTQPTKENDQDFENKLIKQKALSVVTCKSKLSLLEELKNRNAMQEIYEDGFCDGILFAIGYFDMTREEKQKINDYRRSEDNS